MFPAAEPFRPQSLRLSDDERVAVAGDKCVSITRADWSVGAREPHRASQHEGWATPPAFKYKDVGGRSDSPGEERVVDCAWSPAGLGPNAECVLALVTSHSRLLVHGPPAGSASAWDPWADLTAVACAVSPHVLR